VVICKFKLTSLSATFDVWEAKGKRLLWKTLTVGLLTGSAILSDLWAEKSNHCAYWGVESVQ